MALESEPMFSMTLAGGIVGSKGRVFGVLIVRINRHRRLSGRSGHQAGALATKIPLRKENGWECLHSLPECGGEFRDFLFGNYGAKVFLKFVEKGFRMYLHTQTWVKKW